MSSPRLNDAILVGCIFMYMSVFLLGLDGSIVLTKYVGGICQVRVWFTCLGFTIAFGAMFAKTWRVYVIFTNAKLRKKVIQDKKLFMIVSALVLVDVVVLGLWSGFDPLQRKLQNGTLKYGSEVDELEQWETCDCTNYNIWRGIIYSCKGLLLVFGLFLAWETRHVSIPALNDSRYIGMSVYNVVLLSVIGVPLSFVIRSNPNALFALTALVILYCTTVTLCLVFVPKLIAVKRDPEILNSVWGTSSGTSQGWAESLASQDRNIGGPKYIALTAENANLKKHIKEKEEQITGLESRLCKAGVPSERVKKIAQTYKTSTASHLDLSPSISAQREARESVHIELNKNRAEEPDMRKKRKGTDTAEEKRNGGSTSGDKTYSFDSIENATQGRKLHKVPTSRQRYSSTSKIDTREHQKEEKEDMSKKNTLPASKHTRSLNKFNGCFDVIKDNVRSHNVTETYDNPAVSKDVRDNVKKYVRGETHPQIRGISAENRTSCSPRFLYKHYQKKHQPEYASKGAGNVEYNFHDVHDV